MLFSKKRKTFKLAIKWGHVFWEVFIIFTSSHTPYLEVGEKNIRFTLKWGIQSMRSVYYFNPTLAPRNFVVIFEHTYITNKGGIFWPQ